MKRCPTCNRTYDDAEAFCSADATPLVSEAAASEPEATIAVPPAASELPPPQVASTEQAPSDEQPYQQPYQQQSYQQSYQPQWQSPPQQQWGAPPTGRGGNKTLLLAIIGIVVAVAAGLTVYFLMRGSSSSGTSSSNVSSSSTPTASTSTASKRFVGTWVEEERPSSKGSRFTDDGKIMEMSPRGEGQVGTYTVSGDKATVNISERGGKTYTATLESDSRMRLEGEGKTVYLVKK